MELGKIKATWDAFHQDTSDDGWFMQGGCYDYALGFGEALERQGVAVTYWEYGSDEEPMVHVCIGVDTSFFIDFHTFSHTLTGISLNADVYTATKCSWRQIAKEELPTDKEALNLRDIFELELTR